MKTFTDRSLYGLLRWEQWDALREHIKERGEPWWVYAIGPTACPNRL